MSKNNKENNMIKFELDIKVYPQEAIIGASYAFLDRIYIFLDSKKKDKIEVNIKSKKKISASSLKRLKDEFLNELLYNAMRIVSAKRNKKIREFIVGRALFSAVEEAEAESLDDPLGIAVPWEEKYGKRSKK